MIHYTGQPGKGYGWGICNTNLRAEFERLGVAGDISSEVHFIPIADHNLTPSVVPCGKVNFGYTFFEYPLGPKAEENAAKFDLIFAGSTWCKDRLAERGIHNVEVLIQGVDHSIFKPGKRGTVCKECSGYGYYQLDYGTAEEPVWEEVNCAACQDGVTPDGQFRIFSGGKFEYRKGQDLVIAAFKEFSKTHPEAHLVCSWFNPWPQLFTEISMHLGWKFSYHNADHRWDQKSFIESRLDEMGIPSDRFTILPQLSQTDLAREMANTDCGLFPNRCEGGTNLVLMEYIACGRAAVANCWTGHQDICEGIACSIPATVNQRTLWAESTVDQVVNALSTEHAMQVLGGTLRPDNPHKWTWEAAASQVIAAVNRFTRIPTALT